jgi:hypothetical protein
MGSEQETRKDSPLVGRWTYRSFMANPDISVNFEELEFGRGELLVEYISAGVFVGRLILAEEFSFRLSGVVGPGDPPTISFKGVGDGADSNGQLYEYFGCLMPLWPHDRKQRPTIVGTVIRATPPGPDKAPPGLASNFIALKRDALSTATPATPTPATPTPATPTTPTPTPTPKPATTGTSRPDGPETGHTHDSEFPDDQHPHRRRR